MPSSATVRKYSRVREDDDGGDGPVALRGGGASTALWRRSVVGLGGARRSAPNCRRRRRPSSSLLLGNRLRQRLSLDELHGVVMDAPLASYRINRHDVRMMELGGGQGFGLKPPQLRRVHGGRERKHLERDAAIERRCTASYTTPMPAPANLGDEPKVAELSDSWPRCHLFQPTVNRGQAGGPVSDARPINSRLARHASRSSASSG